VSLKDDLETEVAGILGDGWDERDGEVVPDPEDLQLGNDAVNLEAAVLYADMSGSTDLVDNHAPSFAAEVYKSYMVCASRIIKDEGGAVTAYDGDRIMAVFIGNSKNTTAARCALKINWAVDNIVNPSTKAQYGEDAYQMAHVIGIDTSSLFAARIGVRNDNDIVWVGRSANYAAKLTTLNEGFSVYVTGDVFDRLRDDSKYGGNPRQLMWEQRSWTKMNKMRVHRSNWWWPLD
jgi:class 3 adenylate cyclase